MISYCQPPVLYCQVGDRGYYMLFCSLPFPTSKLFQLSYIMSIFDSELFHKELGLEAIKKEGKYYQALSKRSTYPSLSNRLKNKLRI
mgnify:FL=1